MKVTVLGSGAWEGIPAPFCSCKACTSTSPKDKRTRPQFLVESKKGRFFIEISPDIRMQTAKLPIIKDALISHWHFDHMYGLLELHAWAKFITKGSLKLHCSAKTKEWLDKSFAHIPKKVVVRKPFETFSLFGTDITPLPVYHMQHQDAKLTENELKNTFGYLLKNNGKKFAYLADYYQLPKRTINMVKNADVAVLDGTYLFEELFPNKPEQNGEKSDPDHLHGKQIIALAKSLKAKLTIFHSIAHLSEKKHDELQKYLPKNMLLSYDGMKIDL